MFKKIILTLTILSASLYGCKKETPKSEIKEDVVLAKKYLYYNSSIYTDNKLTDKFNNIYAIKGEAVDLLAEEEVKDKKGKTLKVSKIKLSDGNIGYLKSDALVIKIIVISKENARIYKRNNETSVDGFLPIGTIGYVTDEKANWYKAKFPKAGKWGRWIKDGYSSDEAEVIDALVLEKNTDIIASEKSSDNEKKSAIMNIKVISEKNHFIASLAKKELIKNASIAEEYGIEVPSDDEGDEGLPGPEEDDDNNGDGSTATPQDDSDDQGE